MDKLSENPPGGAGSIRPAVQAGRFYPADPAALSRTVDELLTGGAGTENERGAVPPPRAVLAPHAGYIYSGAVAGAAFGAVRGADYTHVLLLAPSHFGEFHGAALPAERAFATPLGVVALDAEALARLANSPLVAVNPAAHAPEHAIEVELPFLQRALPHAFKLVPLLLLRLSDSELFALTEVLRLLIQRREAQGERWLVVASSDTYHGHDRTACTANNKHVMQLLHRGTALDLLAAVRRHSVMACGWAPLVIARLLAGGRADVLAHSDSAAAAPGSGYVVGYVAAAMYEGEPRREN